MKEYQIFYVDKTGKRVDFYRTFSFGYAYGICQRRNAMNTGDTWDFEEVKPPCPTNT